MPCPFTPKFYTRFSADLFQALVGLALQGFRQPRPPMSIATRSSPYIAQNYWLVVTHLRPGEVEPVMWRTQLRLLSWLEHPLLLTEWWPSPKGIDPECGPKWKSCKTPGVEASPLRLKDRYRYPHRLRCGACRWRVDRSAPYSLAEMKLARTWVKGEAPAQMTSFTPPPPTPHNQKPPLLPFPMPSLLTVFWLQ